MNYLFINNEKINYKMQWVKASALITNSNQTRNRSDVGSIAQINQIASNLQPELLAQSFELTSGAPVIDTNNQIISGHGRIEAIKQAYNTHKKLYYSYNQYLQHNVHLCEYANIATGLNEAYILCRVIAPIHNTIEAVHAANNATLSYTPFEIAKINSKRLKSDINQFITSLPLLEQAQYFTDGILNLKAFQDFQNARIIAALPNCTILADFINYPNPDYKNVITAIFNNIDKILEIQANNIELFDQFALALDKFLQIKQNGGNVEDFLLQLDMFDSGLNGADFSNCLNILWNNTRSAKALTSELAIFLNQQSNLDLFDTLETEIISDTYGIHANETHSHVEVANENHSQLDFSNISIESTPTPTMLKIIPRDWQAQIMDEVTTAPEQSLIVNAPTGAGKMVFIMLLVQYYQQFNKPMLILVDRIALIKQLSECATKYGIRHNIIQAKNSINIGSLVTIASVQSYDYTLPPPEYLFIDECHSLYNRVAELIPKAAKAIGFTATAITKGLGLVYERVINATTAQILTRNGILTPFNVLYMSKIDMTNAKLVAGEYSAVEVHKRSAKIYGDVVAMYKQHTPDKRGICFCATKSHCDDVAALFTASGIPVGVYTSSTKEADRVELLRKFDNNEIKLLISVSALSKGFDKGYIEVIMDLRPLRRSLAEYIQLTGRGLRSYQGKTHCTILDFSGNFIRFAADYENISRHGVPEDLNNDVMGFNRPRSEYESDMSLCPQCSSNMCHTCAMCGFELYPRAKITTDTENIEAIELPTLDLSSDDVVYPTPPPRVPKFSILTRVKQFLGVQS